MLFNDMDVAKLINIPMDEDAPPRRVFDAVVGGQRRWGRPRTRWKDQLEEALTSLGVTNWRRRLERSLKAGRSPIIGLLWPHK